MKTSKKQQEKPAPAPWRHALASQGAGAMSTLLFYPLDVVKTRYMAQDGTAVRQHNGMRYSGVRQALQTMVRVVGAGSLLRGAHVAVSASAVSWGLYMFVYRYVEASLGTTAGNAGQMPTSATLMGSCAGNVVVAVMANPLWLVKHRMQLEEASAAATAADQPRNYRTFARGLRHAIATDGVRSLWRGTSAQLLVGMPNAVTFPLYDSAKAATKRRTGNDTLSLGQVCLCSVGAKTVSSILCHPFVLIKVRLQDPKRTADKLVKYVNVASAASIIANREGIRGFYRGIGPALLQTVPRGVAQFSLYEACISLM